MSRYEDLKHEFTIAKQADVAYWDDLREMSKRVCRDFREYLGISRDVMVSVHGQRVPPVVLGTIVNGRFELLKDNKDLRSSGTKIEFAMRLTYDDAQYSSPSNYIVFRCGIEKCPEGYKVDASSNDFDEVSATGPLFTGLFEHLYKISLKNITE